MEVKRWRCSRYRAPRRVLQRESGRVWRQHATKWQGYGPAPPPRDVSGGKAGESVWNEEIDPDAPDWVKEVYAAAIDPQCRDVEAQRLYRCVKTCILYSMYYHVTRVESVRACEARTTREKRRYLLSCFAITFSMKNMKKKKMRHTQSARTTARC